MTDLSPMCNLPEGWVSVQSKSAGTGYDWFLWMSAKTGDSYSYQEGASPPDYAYDDALILFGGQLWLTVSPKADTVNPHANKNATVHLDATNILGGEKFGRILVNSNAPGKKMDTVQVHMTVGGANYSVHPLELHIDVLEGQIAGATLNISNPGGQSSLTYQMTDPVAWLSEIPDNGSILPDQNQDVSVRVDAGGLIAGNYATGILIQTNAGNQQLDTIPVYVHVGPDPDVDIAPMSLSVPIVPGCTKVEKLKVSNLGQGHLGFVTESQAGGPEFVSIMTERDTELNRKLGRDRQPNIILPPANAASSKNGKTVLPQAVPQRAPGAGGGSQHFKGTVLLSEGFEGAWPPAGWTLIQTNTATDHTIPGYWSQSNYSVHSGTYAAGLWWEATHQDEWMISPSFNVAGACTLSFWTYGWEGSTYGDHYYVKVSTNGGSTWDAVFDLSALSGNAWNQWAYPYNIDLSAYSGKSIKIAFHALDPPTNDGLWYIWIVDDVLVQSYGASCSYAVAPAADTLAPQGSEYVTLTFDGSAFQPCDDESLKCNLVFYTNDPDEQTVTVPINMWSTRGDVFAPSCLVNISDVVYLVNYVLKVDRRQIPSAWAM
ncbi:MAG: choice-of-anchor J domain-containing protein [Candidatus Zixiibacteriota bacterium]